MAIFHARMQVIGRSTGRSAVAAAAYRAAERLHDERQRRDHDFTAKEGVVHSEIMLPVGAPERWQDRATLWNEVEATERRKDAQLAREMEFSIPREMSRPEAIRLARDFVAEQFVSRGMVADVNVHWATAGDGEAQPHAHVMLTMREVGPDGFGPKAREWNSRKLYEGVRERWAALANERLAAQGHDVRIDHRSYAEQGISLEPQHKIGPAGARRAARGEDAERRAEHDGIARRNGERIAADPAVALDALTRQHSTFTRQDLARFVNRHSDGAEQFTDVMAKVEAAPELVRLGVDGRGQERFSTREMLAAEQRMEAAGAALSQSGAHRVGVAEIDGAVRRAEAGGLQLGEEQRAAVAHVTAGRDLALVVGYAGTGKSAMLGVARQAWEAAGYRVRGAALSGIAAEGLEGGSGIESRTLASLEWAWKEGRDELTSRDVLVVDEAGMVGSRQTERVLSAAQQAGAKVVLVGDPEQLQADLAKWLAFQELNGGTGTLRRRWRRLDHILFSDYSIKINAVSQRHCFVCHGGRHIDDLFPISRYTVRITPISQQASKSKPGMFSAFQAAFAKRFSERPVDIGKTGRVCMALTFVLSRKKQDRDVDNMSKAILDAFSRAVGFNDRFVHHLDVVKLIFPTTEEYIYIRIAPSALNEHSDVIAPTFHHSWAGMQKIELADYMPSVKRKKVAPERKRR